MTVDIYPDIEAAVRTALRTALPYLAGRVFFGVPGATPTLPLLTLAQVSGGPDDGETPLDRPRLTFSCWGKTKNDAYSLKAALTQWMRQQRSTRLDEHTYCYDVSLITSTWVPDDDAGLARYVCDATFTVAYAKGA